MLFSDGHVEGHPFGYWFGKQAVFDYP